ncbi:uncharacterized protein TNCV_4106161 [Trichonephila clavipes]|nr:uncharacterized protein TNCV_4106161 [Trichonephila clavipes]
MSCLEALRKPLVTSLHSILAWMHCTYCDGFDSIECKTCPSLVRIEGLLATDHVILNHGQVTWTTPELKPPLLTTTPHPQEDVSALDRISVHRCPTRWVFSCTRLEFATRPAKIRYLDHSAPTATGIGGDRLNRNNEIMSKWLSGHGQCSYYAVIDSGFGDTKYILSLTQCGNLENVGPIQMIMVQNYKTCVA